MKKYQLKEEDLDKQVTDEHLDDIASSHCTKWRSLPSRLEMESIVVNDIDRTLSKEEDRRNAFFYKWRDIKGFAATYRVLINALLGIKCGNDAGCVCELVKQSLAKHPSSSASHEASNTPSESDDTSVYPR